MKAVSFNATSINSGNYIVRKVLHDTATPRDLFMYELTRESGMELVNTEWKPKTIIIEGIITGSSASDLDTNIDTFKQLISQPSKNLDIEYESGTRRYVATAKTIQIERDYYNISYAPFSIEFSIPSGFGKDINSSSYSTYSIALHTLESTNFTIAGSVIPKYTIQLHFKSASAVSSVSVMVNGDEITIDEAISAGQVLIVDAQNKKVTIGGIEKRYTGLFPRLILGSNTYQIITGSTSHLYDVLITYTKTYL